MRRQCVHTTAERWPVGARMGMYDGRGGIVGGVVSMASSDARGCVGAGPFDLTLWFARATAYILNACHGT